jgi:outer membrane protein TolC
MQIEKPPPYINGVNMNLARGLVSCAAIGVLSLLICLDTAPALGGIPASGSPDAQGKALAANAPAQVLGDMPAPDLGLPAVSDVIELPKPELKALITIDERMNPYELEASGGRTISLRQALLTAVDQNLDIGIANTRVSSQKWTYLGSLGKFLPTPTLGYYTGYAKGSLNFPIFGSNTQNGSSGQAGNNNATQGSTQGTPINSAFNIATAGFAYDAYQGGKVVFTALQNRNLLRAQRAESKATFSDSLLQTAQNYYNLVLSEALLQVRIRAVETSVEQLRINSQLAQNGLATNLDVLQSKTQLSRDRQALIDQQVARRTAAITLADTLNMQLGEDLAPAVRILRKVRLVSTDLKTGDLLRLAIDHRPELKQYEELRKAAKKAIIVATSPLQPTAKLQGNVIGLGPHISSMETIYALFFSVNWKLNNLGTYDLSNVQSSRYQARQRLLEANKELVTVLDQVRTSLLSSLRSEKNIYETMNEVRSATEELRLAQLRFENGLGTNIDIINAQRDLTTAQIDHAQAIINFNIAQVQLVHDIGLTSVDTLTSATPLMN